MGSRNAILCAFRVLSASTEPSCNARGRLGSWRARVACLLDALIWRGSWEGCSLGTSRSGYPCVFCVRRGQIVTVQTLALPGL